MNSKIVRGLDENNPADIIFINSPIQLYENDFNQTYETVAPLGLGILATVCSKEGYNTGLIDAQALHLTLKTIIENISTIKPKIVGINISTPNAHIVYQILAQIPKETNVIIGGAHATLMPHIVLKESPIAAVVLRGEGNEQIVPLIQRLIQKQPLDNVSGISYKTKNGEIFHQNEKQEQFAGYSIPVIDRKFFCNDPYESNGMLESTIINSKGCVYSCTFCSVPLLSKRKVLYRPIQDVLDEIKELKQKYGVKSIRFMDDLFTVNKNRVHELCQKMIDEKINIRWRALSRVDTVDEDTLQIMKQAGCYKLAFGIESATPRILEQMKKNTSLEQIKNTIQLCQKIGIKTKGFFTIGYEGQTREEIIETFQFAKEIGLDASNFTIVRAYPGTELYEEQLSKQLPEKLLKFHQKEEGLSEKKLTENQRKQKKKIKENRKDLSKTTLYAVANDTQIGNYSREEMEDLLEEGLKKYFFETPMED